ncbi:DMT family transporter [Desulfocurvibacter africanus]|uniref:DMT family transporter n=1 Tax=Desulfocurvibacter africanus TaxID=873 RepID=UPI000426279F|nr:DMT family transporter [Desulfocurvibacter africanus]
MAATDALAMTYGLCSALSWGASDFSGGYATRGAGVITVAFLSQTVGAIFLLALVLLLGAPMAAAGSLLFGAMAGLCGAMGLMGLYTGLSKGRMGVIAPTSAVLAALLPTLFAMLTQGLPAASTLLGFPLAMAAVWLLSSSGGMTKRQLSSSRELLMALLAGAGFGLFFICIDAAGGEGFLWTLLCARGASISMFGLVLLTRGGIRAQSQRQMVLIAICGLLDTTGNALFAMAAHLGRLDIAAVLCSLYPGVTIMLACLLLKERLSLRQWGGVGAALGAIVLIAS